MIFGERVRALSQPPMEGRCAEAEAEAAARSLARRLRASGGLGRALSPRCAAWARCRRHRNGRTSGGGRTACRLSCAYWLLRCGRRAIHRFAVLALCWKASPCPFPRPWVRFAPRLAFSQPFPERLPVIRRLDEQPMAQGRRRRSGGARRRGRARHPRRRSRRRGSGRGGRNGVRL
jgi:hypothetical protein